MKKVTSEQNEDLKVDLTGDYLNNKVIALCVTGGIAAIETPKIARHLRRYGAEVYAYMTPNAQKIITPIPLKWATGNSVVTELTGDSEHIKPYDAVIVSPATLNTIGQIAHGLADNNVTSLVASALGAGTPIYLSPTMHESLENNPIYKKNINELCQYNNIHKIPARISEGKAKMPKLENIVAEISRGLSSHPIKGKKILITGGPTPGKIDDVRIVTNIFKGKLALEMAKDAYHKGADVKLLLGKAEIKVPSYLDVSYHNGYNSYRENVMDELEKGDYDAGIFSAAVADYIPKDTVKGKIPSQGALKNIPLKETKKIIQEVRNAHPELYMVTFKFEGNNISHDQLMEIAKNRLNKYDLVVANRAAEMGQDYHKAHIVGNEGVIASPESKVAIARHVIDEMAKRIQ